MKILIVVAMEKESVVLIEQLQLKSVNIAAVPMAKLFQGMLHGSEIFLMLPGKDPYHTVVDCIGALIQIPTYLAITTLRPDVIINAGTAGAIAAKGAQKFKPYLGSTAMGHDGHFPENDPMHRQLVLGNYPVSDGYALAKALGFDYVPISTTGSMLTTKESQKLLDNNQAILVDMEWKYIVHAVLQAANADYRPQYFCLKITTDFIDSDSCPQAQFMAAIEDGQVLALLASACCQLIAQLKTECSTV